MVSSSSVSPWRFVELCCGPTSLSSGPRTSPITLTTSLHPLEPQRPMRSLLMRPFHACPSQLFREPKTNTSNWAFHKPDSAFSRLFVFTRSTNSSLDTQLLQSFQTYCTKEKESQGPAQTLPREQPAACLHPFSANTLSPNYPVESKPTLPRKPRTLRHSHFRKKKIKFWTGGGKKIMGHSHHTQWEALIILCSLSFS